MNRLNSICLFAALLWAAGCGGENVPDISETLSDARDAVEQTVENVNERVQQATGQAGEIAVNVDAPVKVPACYARLNTFSDGRPSVLEIASYKQPGGQAATAVYLQAQVAATEPSALVGSTVTAEAFVQNQADALWHSNGATVQLRIDRVAEGQFAAQVIEGTLENAASGEQIALSGTFAGSIE